MSASSARRAAVVVTRAAEQAGSLADRLRARGFDVVEVPVVAVAEAADGGAALADALARLDTYDWLVVTSPNGAARVRDAVARLAPVRRPRLAAVGPGTADALGVPVDLVAATSVGEGLVADFPQGSGRVLLAQAEAARRVVAEGLAAKGWRVDTVVAYRTVPARVPEERLRALAGADIVVFTSGSTVREFVAAAGLDRVPPAVVSIGPQTSAVAADLGVRVTVTADPHTLEGVVRAVEELTGGTTDTRPEGPYR